MTSLLLLVAGIVLGGAASPLVRSAPEECPLNDGNLLNVKLFVKDAVTCLKTCQKDPVCNYYQHYPAMDGKPPQCFFYETCGRTVYEAPPECVMSKENCLGIQPFVRSAGQCQEMCQKKRKCGYYKFIHEQDIAEETAAATPKGRQIPISRLTEADTPEFCYLLSSCSKRMIENVLCTIGENNFLDVKLFTPSLSACQQHCEDTTGCRYYYWYPIDYSAAPLYCYLFQQCAAGDDEPLVALVVGGRHPGHYFLDSGDFTDVVTRTDVCPMTISPADTMVKRAGAAAGYAEGGVVLCGGRSGTEVHTDCVRYDLESEQWADHSSLLQPRDESTMAMVGSELYIMGGIGEKSVEILDTLQQEQAWNKGPELPDVLSRSCAVSTGSSIILTGGHSNSSSQSLATSLQLDPQSGSWVPLAPLTTPRRDHGCLYVEFESSRGVLVTGGQGPDDSVLGSAEFYDLATQQWTMVSPLKVARTEHSMSLIFGVPTIIGGVNGDQFISSLEQFDKSGNSWNVPLRRDWRIINQVLTSPRYEHTVASVPASKMTSCSEADNEV